MRITRQAEYPMWCVAGSGISSTISEGRWPGNPSLSSACPRHSRKHPEGTMFKRIAQASAIVLTIVAFILIALLGGMLLPHQDHASIGVVIAFVTGLLGAFALTFLGIRSRKNTDA